MKQNSDCIQKWENFSNGVTIIYETSTNKLTPRKLRKVRSETNINFPKGYLEFLTVFGSGELGVSTEKELPKSIRIHLAKLKWSNTQIGYFSDAVSAMSDTFQGRSEREEKNKQLELLNNSFAFADSDRVELFLFDLRSYSSDDRSYNLYKTCINSFHSDLIGRDFYDFIEAYCFGFSKGEEAIDDEIDPIFFCRNYRT